MLNLTPHEIVVGDRKFPPSGTVARVSSAAEPRESYDGIPVVHTTYGQIAGLPVTSDVPVLVSLVVLAALDRHVATDREANEIGVTVPLRGLYPYRILCPDTGPDSVVRDSAGKITGVKRLME